MPDAPPAHYIVFHPDKARFRAKVTATALLTGHRVDAWTGSVWVDKPPGNEDPFVLGPSWAFSYCHATQLRRNPRRSAAYVREGSCILFCSGQLADSDRVLAVDTLFWIAAAHRWKAPNQPPSRYARDIANRTDLWKYHLRFGGPPPAHAGRFTYEAALYPQTESQYARLPLTPGGERVRVPLSALSRESRELIEGHPYGKRPVLLAHEHLTELLALLKAHTEIEVIGSIVLEDAAFLSMREDASEGCELGAARRHSHRRGIRC